MHAQVYHVLRVEIEGILEDFGGLMISIVSEVTMTSSCLVSQNEPILGSLLRLQ